MADLCDGDVRRGVPLRHPQLRDMHLLSFSAAVGKNARTRANLSVQTAGRQRTSHQVQQRTPLDERQRGARRYPQSVQLPK